MINATEAMKNKLESVQNRVSEIIHLLKKDFKNLNLVKYVIET
jgi:hypothetical protein